LPAVLVRPVRCIQSAAAFDAPQYGQQFRGVNFGNWPRPDPREHVKLKAAKDLFGVGRCPRRLVPGKPFPRHSLEAMGCPFDDGPLPRFTVQARIDTAGQKLPRFIAFLTGLGNGNVRISAKGKSLLFSLGAIVHPPQFPAIGVHQQVKPAFISQLVRLGFWFGLAGLDVSQHAGLLQFDGIDFRKSPDTIISTNNNVGIGCYGARQQKTRKPLKLTGFETA
jgi:hypothetical protein